MFSNSHLFLLKLAKALEKGVCRDIPASQVPLFKGTHWGKSVPLGTLQPLLPTTITSLSSPQPLPGLLIQQSQLFWAPHSLCLWRVWLMPGADGISFSFNCLAWACCPGSSTSWWHMVGTSREWLRGSCGSLGDGGAASHRRLYLPFQGCRQGTGIQRRPDPNV